MGADQSSASSQQLRSQRDEDIPYTSYSISKPIDADSSRVSPIRNIKSRPQIRSDNPNQLTPGSHDIVVVASASEPIQEDAELQKLENIPLFMPLIRGSLNIPNSTHENDILDKIDGKQLLQLCLRYQDHLKQCSEAVAFDQNALCVRIKEVDFVVQSLYANLTERQKGFAKYAEQIQKVQEMSNVLNRVKMNVEQIVPLMERLNSVLPPEEQLEAFSLKSK